MNIKDYIDEVLSDADIFHDITCDGTYKEAKDIERLCNVEISRERLIEAWSIIISCIIERFKNEEEVNYLTEFTLDFLIRNKICLIDLGHLKLKSKWLRRIYSTDSRCWEALRTLEERKK